MATIENDGSFIDNIGLEMVKQETKKEIKTLTDNITSNFYEKDEEKGITTIHVSVVKQYLSDIIDKDCVEIMNLPAGIMAIQILLMLQGFEIEKFDGIFGSNTKRAVKQFQEAVGFRRNDIDGIPGPKTIKCLLENMDSRGVFWFNNRFEAREIKSIVDDYNKSLNVDGGVEIRGIF